VQWSKLKKQTESNFASSVSGRVEVKSTRYHNAHDQTGRGYITIDGKDVYNFCTLTQMKEEFKTSNEIREISGNTDFRNKDHQKGYYQAYKEARRILHKKGIYSQEEFYKSLKEFHTLSIDKAINSENLIIKCLALLDKRLGKRKLVNMSIETLDHPILKRIYIFRCNAEKININQIAT
jgi:hypothetical protein